MYRVFGDISSWEKVWRSISTYKTGRLSCGQRAQGASKARQSPHNGGEKGGEGQVYIRSHKSALLFPYRFGQLCVGPGAHACQHPSLSPTVAPSPFCLSKLHPLGPAGCLEVV